MRKFLLASVIAGISSFFWLMGMMGVSPSFSAIDNAAAMTGASTAGQPHVAHRETDPADAGLTLRTAEEASVPRVASIADGNGDEDSDPADAGQVLYAFRRNDPADAGIYLGS